ncbi:hypothetical protein GCM10011321_14360 [Youhaiella tibetensis]|uniref:Uncharacterized protein n=1 Tax=Paradevosia tibetensis TaxID=1447062 RepID=A0A5B9DP13_9HYPH|nr:hypothetical protein [Youhaiella tibetensis]QEE20439.1 hypothetical protein FNA67_09765 [Youhaiella tibetensis]GGF24148.1 hypothetical protein GCM10011321_14360 [Youhaiella tibetensis]
MNRKTALTRLPAEKLNAWRNYHTEALALAAEYGRRSPKDEAALKEIERELCQRKRCTATPAK